MTPEPPTLYSFRRCPYAMRARMALLVSRVPVLVHEIALADKPVGLRLASAKATVPVLVLSGGTVLDESRDIMTWCLQASDPDDWLGGVDDKLLAASDGGFKHDLDRYKYPERYGVDPDVYRARGLEFLIGLEARLGDAPGLCRAATAYTDIAVAPFVRQFAATDRSWFDALPLPRLQEWLAAFEASALFAAAMVRYPVGQPSPLRFDG